MKYVGEKEAENFLEKAGFNVVPRAFCGSKGSLKNAIEKVGIPFVMKVSGKKIIHKNKVEGIRLDVKTYSNALDELKNLKKIKGAEGVLIQRKMQGKEFLIGVKKTPEFGHIIVFGAGGIETEEKKDVSFRVAPLEKDEIKKMIKDVRAASQLLKKDGEAIEKMILDVCSLVEKYPNISELDLNPVMVKDGIATIVDARIVKE